MSDSELVLSNFVTGGVPDGAFSFDVSIGSRDILGIGKVSVITGKLDIPKILLVQDGYYNLIIYRTVSNALLTDEKVYDKL